MFDFALGDTKQESTDDLSRGGFAALPIIGLTYGHFEICQTAQGTAWELGRGAMGITYKATDSNLGRTVAVKVIHPHLVDGAGNRARFLREARAASNLHHPHIASIFHLGVEHDECFYAMEYVVGETLEARVQRQGPLPIEAAIKIAVQVAEALDHAHTARFIHRDVKPSNIMLAADSGGTIYARTVKLIDFGLVKAVSSQEEDSGHIQNYFAGTPAYASPEQIAGGTVDVRSDLYSLGCSLWYMLSGIPPSFHASGDCMSGSSVLPDQTPLPLRRLLASLTALNPHQRPQSAAELLRCLRGLELVQRLENRSKWVRFKGKSQKLWGAAVALLVLTAGAWMTAFLAAHQITPVPAPSTMVSVNSHLEARALYAQGQDHLYKLTKADNLQAIGCLGQAVALDPNFAAAHAALACVYLQGVDRFGAPPSQREAAILSAQRAIALDPKAPDGHSVLAEIRTSEGMHWMALQEYHRALELDVNYLPAMRGFSLLWSMVGQPQCGLPWAKAATRLDPFHRSGWNAAADANVDLCNDEQAQACYERCLEIDPKWLSARCGLLHIHLLQSKFAQAWQDYEVIAAIDPHLILPRTLQAQIALFSGDYPRAEILYRELLTMERTGYVHYYSSISYLSALGFLRLKAGDRTEAHVLLAEADTLHLQDSEGPQATYDLAAIRAVQGRNEDALKLLEQAIIAGWVDFRATRLDPRFEGLRSYPSFEQMLTNLQSHVERMRAEGARLCAAPLRIADFPVIPPTR